MGNSISLQAIYSRNIHVLPILHKCIIAESQNITCNRQKGEVCSNCKQQIKSATRDEIESEKGGTFDELPPNILLGLGNN